MNHQPFESWLLSEDTLEEDQLCSLRGHLEQCDNCTDLEISWKEVQQLLDETPQVAPADGFVTRWQARLLEEKKKRHAYQSWFLFTGVAVSAAVLLLLLLFQATPVLNSPVNLVLLLIYRLMSIVASVQTAQSMAFSLFSTIANLVPAPVWIGLFGTFCMICVLWFGLIKQLAYSRRLNL